jgi:hypothetical protein
MAPDVCQWTEIRLGHAWLEFEEASTGKVGEDSAVVIT